MYVNKSILEEKDVTVLCMNCAKQNIETVATRLIIVRDVVYRSFCNFHYEEYREVKVNSKSLIVAITIVFISLLLLVQIPILFMISVIPLTDIKYWNYDRQSCSGDCGEVYDKEDLFVVFDLRILCEGCKQKSLSKMELLEKQ